MSLHLSGVMGIIEPWVAQAAPSSAPPDWILRLLSVDPDALEGSTAHFRFARLPEGAWALLALILLLAGGAFIVWLYRREGNVPGPRRAVMASLRVGFLIVLGLVLAYPVLEVDRARDVRATTIVLVDESRSHGIRDRYLSSGAILQRVATRFELEPSAVTGMTRAEIVERALDHDGWRVLARLAEKNRLKVYGFAGPLRPIAAAKPSTPPDADPARRAEPPSSANPETDSTSVSGASPSDWEGPIDLELRGDTTDIASAIRTSVEAEAGTRVAAVVVVSDGRITAGEDLKGVAGLLRSQRIPVYAVGVGDPAPTRNLRLAAIVANERVFVGDPIAIDVRLEQHGYGGETVRVELTDTARSADGVEAAPVTIGTRDVELPADASELTIHFEHAPEGIGPHRIVARIDPDPEESFADDNERAFELEVVEEASRVLLVAGGPSYEYRYLKNLFKRDARITVAAWLMSADPEYPQEGDVQLKRLPDTAKDLFEYDVVVLMDVDPRAMPPAMLSLLESFVSEHHGGLAYIAGDKYSIEFFDAPAAAGLRDALPVLVESIDVRDQLEQGYFYEREWSLVPTDDAALHAATRLSSQVERNRMRWAEIAGFFWSFPARRAKPGATVLFVHPDPSLARDGHPRPLVATQYFGGGRVLWSGIDATWRWRPLAEEIYERFWIQSIRFLTEGRLVRRERALVQTDRDTYELGETWRLGLYLLDENYQPIEAEDAALTITEPDGDSEDVHLVADANSPGWFRGLFDPSAIGEYAIEYSAGSESEPKRVRVDAPRLEFLDPRLDDAALRELAESTGGRYVDIDAIDGIPDGIPDRRQVVVASEEPIPLWDNWFCMTVLAILLAAEWILRKLNRLL